MRRTTFLRATDQAPAVRRVPQAAPDTPHMQLARRARAGLASAAPDVSTLHVDHQALLNNVAAHAFADGHAEDWPALLRLGCSRLRESTLPGAAAAAQRVFPPGRQAGESAVYSLARTKSGVPVVTVGLTTQPRGLAAGRPISSGRRGHCWTLARPSAPAEACE